MAQQLAQKKLPVIKTAGSGCIMSKECKESTVRNQ
jgi:hypothetical protein